MSEKVTYYKCKNCGLENIWHNVSSFCCEECLNEYNESRDWID